MKTQPKLTESQLKVKKLIAPLVKNLVKEASAYERGSDKNLKKEFTEFIIFLNTWTKHLDAGNVDANDLDLILRKFERVVSSIKLHRDNWDN